MRDELWRAVVSAIEDAIPEYDRVNQKVSLGRASIVRKYAVEKLALKEGMVVLDAGIGPGTMSETVLQDTPEVTIVGLDGSTKLLQAARSRFSGNTQVHFVRAVFEAVPVRDGALNGIVSAFAFRDARDREAAIDEFSRATNRDGSFLIVDLGKPDNLLKRAFVTAYIQYLMPLVARFSKSKRIAGNPWRMIVPTFKLLATNSELMQALKRRFDDVRIWEFSFGGIIVILARKVGSGSAS